MREGNYPTPAQVSVFLGDVWLDDAYRVELRDQDPKIPLYGYAESEYSTVAQGKRLVQGSLIINYRYPEYLRAAIDGHGPRQTEMDRTIALAHSLRNSSILERIGILEEARFQGVGKEVGDILVANYDADGPPAKASFPFSQGVEKELEPAPTDLPSTMRVSKNQPIEIKIFFDTPDQAGYHTVIQGVHLVGRAMTISNAANGGGDASSSGQNLFELYTFFGKRIVNRRTQRWQADTTLAGYGQTSQQEIRDSIIPTAKSQGTES